MSTPTLLFLANSVLAMLAVLFALYLVALGVSLSGARNERLHRISESILGGNLRKSFTTGLVLLAGVLPIALGIGLAQRSADHIRTSLDERLRDTVIVLTRTVDDRMSEYVRAIDTLSQLSIHHKLPSQAVSTELAAVRDTYTTFLTMLVTDPAGNVVAAVPRLEELGLVENSGRGPKVSDRSYFTEPRATGEPYVSDVFQGRGFGRDPIIAISAPLLDDEGNFNGVVEASVDLASFWDLRRLSLRWPEAETLIVDRFNRVIHSSRRGMYPVLEEITDQPIILKANENNPGESFRVLSTDDNGVQHEFVGSYGLTEHGWKVFVTIDSNIPDSNMRANFRVTALWALFTAILGVLLAIALHRRIGQPLSLLHELVTKFDSEDVDRLLKSGTRKRGIPDEFRQIFVEFRNLRRRLMVAITRQREALRESERLRVELEDVVSERERVIARRTAELERANQLLEREAKIDTLTALPNRRGLLEFLDRCWRICQRREEATSVILIDVDDYRACSDEYGRTAGDTALQEVATVIERNCRRTTDFAGRWDGTEFLVILCETDLDEAWQIAENIRATLEHDVHKWNSNGTGDAPPLTISAGVASTHPSHGTHDGTTLIDAAEQALKQGRSRGNNRVTVNKDS